jgi:hypothetical protein
LPRVMKPLKRLKGWIHYGNWQKLLKKATRRCWALL